ncbi:hypothetical protein ACMAZF_01490 [Psychrobium sp. nBUS_13]|uniref:hypothetical protein n=1 Tax=Psychrobium sp. nBUS_13 TaxID=3395319 RepID=UPI003EBA32DE
MAYFDAVIETVNTGKLLIIRGIGVIMAIACVIELVKLRTVKWQNLIINDQLLRWGTKAISYQIHWETIQSVTVVGENQTILKCEFVLSNSKQAFGYPILSSANYDLEANNFLSLLAEKAKEHQFTVSEIE